MGGQAIAVMKITLTLGDSGRPYFRIDSQLVEPKDGLKAIREKYTLTRKSLGNLCGVGARTVESWEQGRYTPSKPATMLLAAWLEKK